MELSTSRFLPDRDSQKKDRPPEDRAAPQASEPAPSAIPSSPSPHPQATGSGPILKGYEGQLAMIVDDAQVDRKLASAVVEKLTGMRLILATNGQEALELLATELPSVVLTDLQMPGLNGLELVQRLHDLYPTLPVILMTATGSEEIAIKALRAGAASYVPKRSLLTELSQALPQVLSAAKDTLERDCVESCMTRLDYQFELPADPVLLSPLVAYLRDLLLRLGYCDANGMMQLGIAIEESLKNALYHGSLEVGTALRRKDPVAYAKLVEERKQQQPYCDRLIYLSAIFDPEKAEFVIRDEGPGFDVESMPDFLSNDALLAKRGRGLLLIQTFMDEVRLGPKGNQITLVRMNPKAAQ